MIKQQKSTILIIWKDKVYKKDQKAEIRHTKKERGTLKMLQKIKFKKLK